MKGRIKHMQWQSEQHKPSVKEIIQMYEHDYI